MTQTARTPTTKRWTLAPTHELAAGLAARLKVSPLVAQILLNRGISEPDDCHKFLKPTLKDLHDPACSPACRRRRSESPGRSRPVKKSPSTAIMTSTASPPPASSGTRFKLLGGDAHYYIPHRVEEGYGLNAEAIEELCNTGTQLLITVDCGVTAIEPAKAALARGVDLIITDHTNLNLLAITQARMILKISRRPTRSYTRACRAKDGQLYPNKNLCGAGVAFKLAWGIGQAVNGQAKVSDASAPSSSRRPRSRRSARSPTSCRSSVRTASSPTSDSAGSRPVT